MGPQVHLRMPVLRKGEPVHVEFMAFGGGYVDQGLRSALESCPHTGVSSDSLGKACAEMMTVDAGSGGSRLLSMMLSLRKSVMWCACHAYSMSL